jgi:hypothetical protein
MRQALIAPSPSNPTDTIMRGSKRLTAPPTSGEQTMASTPMNPVEMPDQVAVYPMFCCNHSGMTTMLAKNAPNPTAKVSAAAVKPRWRNTCRSTTGFSSVDLQIRMRQTDHGNHRQPADFRSRKPVEIASFVEHDLECRDPDDQQGKAHFVDRGGGAGSGWPLSMNHASDPPSKGRPPAGRRCRSTSGCRR